MSVVVLPRDGKTGIKRRTFLASLVILPVLQLLPHSPTYCLREDVDSITEKMQVRIGFDWGIP